MRSFQIVAIAVAAAALPSLAAPITEPLNDAFSRRDIDSGLPPICHFVPTGPNCIKKVTPVSTTIASSVSTPVSTPVINEFAPRDINSLNSFNHLPCSLFNVPGCIGEAPSSSSAVPSPVGSPTSLPSAVQFKRFDLPDIPIPRLPCFPGGKGPGCSSKVIQTKTPTQVSTPPPTFVAQTQSAPTFTSAQTAAPVSSAPETQTAVVPTAAPVTSVV